MRITSARNGGLFQTSAQLAYSAAAQLDLGSGTTIHIPATLPHIGQAESQQKAIGQKYSKKI
jgi:hypothetical protein